MTAKELADYLGLSEETAKAIIADDKVAAKAATLKQQSEYDSLAARAAQLEKDSTGAKVYQDWYAKNYTAIEQLQKDALRYKERFGDLDAPEQKTVATNQIDEAKVAELIQRGVDERIQKVYGNQWSNLITKSGTVLEKHLRNKRDKPIDWGKLSELAQTKGGDLESAYDEYDRPEAEASAKKSTDELVERRVKEELAKRQTQNLFPAGADGTPSGSTGITRREPTTEPKYDRNKVIQSAITGKYDGAVQ